MKMFRIVWGILGALALSSVAALQFFGDKAVPWIVAVGYVFVPLVIIFMLFVAVRVFCSGLSIAKRKR
jgi:hypothetical protein